MPIMAEKRKAGFGVLPNVVFYKSGSSAPRRLLFFAIFLLRRHADSRFLEFSAFGVLPNVILEESCFRHHADYKDEKFFSASCRNFNTIFNEDSEIEKFSALNSKMTNFLKMTCFYQPCRIHLSCDFYAVSNIDSETEKFSARFKFRMTRFVFLLNHDVQIKT